ncbi:MAG: NAD-dependent deacetylase [Alphaproteobacteria bacterium]|nr:NAD-dependent deacetylase [Alphaproteobacteria bacterium]
MRTPLGDAWTLLESGRPVLVTAGAGLGVDSGLPDFRGAGGLWRDGRRIEERARPEWFDEDPEEAWAFYDARRRAYRGTAPHAGFAVLAGFVARGGFVFTSNVDGHFQAAGVDPERIVEIHGSLDRVQCATPCSRETWEAPAPGGVPRCPRCGGVARPNVNLFADRRWIAVPSILQGRRYDRWLGSLDAPPVVLELGAGTAVPNVRQEGERLLATGADLIRVNPHEPGGPPGTLEVAMGALAFLREGGPHTGYPRA